MRIHFAIAIAVMVAAVWAGVSRLELIALLLSITFVLVAEMINSAIEQAIDMATTSFDPLAKLAKDIAAGAVLIAAMNAVAVGYLVFSHAFGSSAWNGLERLRDLPTSRDADRARAYDPARDRDEGLPGPRHAVAGRVALGPRGRRLRGLGGSHVHPQPEGAPLRRLLDHVRHGLARRPDRIEAGVHSTLEVVYGGLLGALVTLAVFQLFF